MRKITKYILPLIALTISAVLYASQILYIDMTTVAITIIAVGTFIFIMLGIAIEGNRFEAREKRNPYEFKKRSLWWCIKNDLKNIKTEPNFKEDRILKTGLNPTANPVDPWGDYHMSSFTSDDRDE